MFDIHMLPAEHGDCLWLTYGDANSPKHILIDAGTTDTWPRLKARLDRVRNGGPLRFELFVVTHIDADHIGGSIKLLEECGPMQVTFGEVWFNGFAHLDNEAPDELGAMQGELLTALIVDHALKWNAKFERRAVMVPDTGALPAHTYSGMRLTLLSPTFEKLQKLKPEWEKVVRDAGLVPGHAAVVEDVEEGDDTLGDSVEDMAESTFKGDSAKPNGASIAFVAEHDGKRVLFTGDAHADVLLASLRRGPLAHADTLALDAFKVSHHGSRANLDRALVEAAPAQRYLISTNGKQFRHPDPEALARIAVFGPESKAFDFNYRTELNKAWDHATRKAKWGLTTRFGSDDEGLVVKL
ncbi:MAG: MBL fold metallo-hydrolase [Burkholderiales bacterium]|nr:MBL fold metallo-hydrolase [Burkholderiales bacterium]